MNGKGKKKASESLIVADALSFLELSNILVAVLLHQDKHNNIKPLDNVFTGIIDGFYRTTECKSDLCIKCLGKG